MTLQQRSGEVGVRELHDRLSEYLRRVEAGERIVVTSRGRAIARISAMDGADPLKDLRNRGLIREPTRPKRRADDRGRPEPTAPVADLVASQRR